MEFDDLPQPDREAVIPRDELHVDGENPNEQDDDTFSDLKRGMQDRGWVGGPIVANTGGLPGYDGAPEGLICDGEHRWRAAEDLGIGEVPVKYIDFDDDAERRLWRQRLNKTTGEHDTKRDALEVDAILDAGGYTEDLESVMAAADQEIDELLAAIRDDGVPVGYEYDDDHNVYFEDCLEGMRERLEDDSVDMVFTSPPYNVDLGGEDPDEHLERSGRTYYSDDRSDAEFREFIHEVLTELARVTKPGGHIFFNYRNDYREKSIDIPTWVLEACPIPCRSYIVWNKKNIARSGITAPSHGRFAPTWEPIFHFSEDPAPLDGSRNFDVFDARPSSYEHGHDTGEHPAPFSVQLVEQAIEPTTDPGDLVLDPFMGSGTTAVAAIRNDRDYIGFELDEEGAYQPIVERRIDEAKRQRAAAVNRGDGGDDGAAAGDD